MSGLVVLWRDARYAVVDKPAGMSVHPSRNDPAPSIEDLFPTLGRVRAGPFLAHRLDRDTSGCLVVALSRSALRAAQACFATGQVRKTYWALVEGAGPTGEASAGQASSGVVRSHLGRVQRGASWRIEEMPGGQDAETAWRLAGRRADGRLAWLELWPRTGRTHQLRVHCAALGCPIVGDAVYGRGIGRLALHARAIALPLDPPVAVMAPPPIHMQTGLLACGLEGTDPSPG